MSRVSGLLINGCSKSDEEIEEEEEQLETRTGERDQPEEKEAFWLSSIQHQFARGSGAELDSPSATCDSWRRHLELGNAKGAAEAVASAPNTVRVEQHLCDVWAVLEMTSPFLAPSGPLPGSDPL